jgi:hypothetical protein
LDRPESFLEAGVESGSGYGSTSPIPEGQESDLDGGLIEQNDPTFGSERLLNPLPLESVWPVSQVEPPRGSAERVFRSTERPAGETGATGPALVPSGRPPGSSETLSRALQEVKPGQPSSSSIELIQPRGPRPAPSSGASRPGGEAEVLSRTVQRAADTGQTPAAQRVVRAEDAAAEIVQTEAGPLPADLWSLIGQAPPAGRQVESTPAAGLSGEPAGMPAGEARPASRGPEMDRPASAQSPAEGAPPVQAERRLQAGSLPPASAPTAAQPAVLRSAAPPQAGGEGAEGGLQFQPETRASGAGPASPDGGEAKEAGAGTDLDELVNQVYAEVRRRIAVEWERWRGAR